MDAVTELLLLCLVAEFGSAVAMAHDDPFFTAIFAGACGYALVVAIQLEFKK
jgi:hypothetical protein